MPMYSYWIQGKKYSANRKLYPYLEVVADAEPWHDSRAYLVQQSCTQEEQEEPVMSAELPHKPLITSCRLSSSETSSELVSEEERRQDVIRGLCIQAQSARDCALEKLEATEAERSACKAEMVRLQTELATEKERCKQLQSELDSALEKHQNVLDNVVFDHAPAAPASERRPLPLSEQCINLRPVQHAPVANSSKPEADKGKENGGPAKDPGTPSPPREALKKQRGSGPPPPPPPPPPPGFKQSSPPAASLNKLKQRSQGPPPPPPPPPPPGFKQGSPPAAMAGLNKGGPRPAAPPPPQGGRSGLNKGGPPPAAPPPPQGGMPGLNKGGPRPAAPPPPPEGDLLRNKLHQKLHQKKLQRIPEVADLARLLKQGATNQGSGTGGKAAIGGSRAAAPVDRGDLLKELTSMSKHAQDVQKDVAQHGEMIEQMALTIREEKPSNMEDLARFVAFTEQRLTVLNDEVETLKHFHWPSAKLDRFKEAAALHNELNKSFKEDMSKAVNGSFKAGETGAYDARIARITKAADKVKSRVERLEGTMEAQEKAFKANNIPWDTNSLNHVKQSSLVLANAHMEASIAEAQFLQERAADGNENAVKAHRHLKSSSLFAHSMHILAQGFDDSCAKTFTKLHEMVMDSWPATCRPTPVPSSVGL